jgi:hypothetical protein
LHDPSLRYTQTPFAGPSASTLFIQVGGFILGLALFLVPLIRQALLSNFSFWTLIAVAGIPLGLEMALPLRRSLVEAHHRFWYQRFFRPVNLGLERAVPQPGTALRYEVHLHAKHAIRLDSVQVRLVFWESWRTASKLRFSRIRRWITEKQGHDLVKHEVETIELLKGQHAVIRGSIPIPLARPTEHHRGKPKHISYVNVTVTLTPTALRTKRIGRGSCPHLVTFPWM